MREPFAKPDVYPEAESENPINVYDIIGRRPARLSGIDAEANTASVKIDDEFYDLDINYVLYEHKSPENRILRRVNISRVDSGQILIVKCRDRYYDLMIRDCGISPYGYEFRENTKLYDDYCNFVMDAVKYGICYMDVKKDVNREQAEEPTLF